MGVYKKYNGKWVARTPEVNGKREHLGTYPTKFQAEQRVKLWGMEREMDKQIANNKKHLEDAPSYQVPVVKNEIKYEQPKPTIFGKSLAAFRKYWRDRREMKKVEKEFFEKMKRW